MRFLCNYFMENYLWNLQGGSIGASWEVILASNFDAHIRLLLNLSRDQNCWGQVDPRSLLVMNCSYVIFMEECGESSQIIFVFFLLFSPQGMCDLCVCPNVSVFLCSSLQFEDYPYFLLRMRMPVDVDNVEEELVPTETSRRPECPTR